jgi:hypothetical protein
MSCPELHAPFLLDPAIKTALSFFILPARFNKILEQENGTHMVEEIEEEDWHFQNLIEGSKPQMEVKMNVLHKPMP